MVYSGNDGEVEQLKKRVRRGKIEAQKKMEREEGVAMEVTEEEHGPGTGSFEVVEDEETFERI